MPDSGVPVEFDKTTLETELLRKAAAISNATTEQIDAYKKGEKCPATPTNEGLGFMAPAISIVLPEATHAQ